MMTKFLTSLSATALVLAPVAASAAPATSPAAKLSVAKSARAGTATAKADRLAGVSIVPAILGALIIAGGIYLIVDDNDDSDSN
ncbi:hypothetical protein [Sphingomonas sp. TZW2008]|uniref:hypothetical protein n=1 Tax=Sphingomonas sp. TZW2008 TaxID=1917973 RepID=UPI000A26C0FE|nr:hypothetical protein [Sphingomonas sp. TZW2008]